MEVSLTITRALSWSYEVTLWPLTYRTNLGHGIKLFQQKVSLERTLQTIHVTCPINECGNSLYYEASGRKVGRANCPQSVWVQRAERIAVAHHCWCLSPETYALFCWRAWGCRKGKTVKGTTQEQPKTPVNFLSAQVILLTEQPSSSAACSVTMHPSYRTATILSAEAAFPFLMMNDVTFYFKRPFSLVV